LLPHLDPNVATCRSHPEKEKYDAQIWKSADFSVKPVPQRRADKYGKNDRGPQLKGVACQPPSAGDFLHEDTLITRNKDVLSS
jgi:hypothetical protein